MNESIIINKKKHDGCDVRYRFCFMFCVNNFIICAIRYAKFALTKANGCK
jgi:hypothetical protein